VRLIERNSVISKPMLMMQHALKAWAKPNTMFWFSAKRMMMNTGTETSFELIFKLFLRPGSTTADTDNGALVF
jgi:hypothetical protein